MESQNPYSAPNFSPQTPEIVPREPRDESGPEGLGGWLVLVAVGLFVTAIQAGYHLATNYIPLIFGENWKVLTDPASPAYHPLWAPLLIFEMAGNLAIMTTAGVALVLFFRRSPWFPKLMIAYYLGCLVYVVSDLGAAQLIPAVANQVDGDSMRDLFRTMFTCAIWIPYMLRSRRVRNTFRAQESEWMAAAPRS